ncbi:peptidoglycan DD-metalloendopeptidase family protein [Sutcliffiella cohnii]
METFNRQVERGKQFIKNRVKKAIKKFIMKILKKILMKLVFLIMKAVMLAVGALIALLGIPLTIILAILIILGGAMFTLAPFLGLLDNNPDSPRTQEEVKIELETLWKDSSENPNYRPPMELISSIDLMRIIHEDLQPWEVNFKPIVNTLSPDLTYADYNDTYEIKTVITETYEVTTYETRIEKYYEDEEYTETITRPVTVTEEVPIYGWKNAMNCDDYTCWIEKVWTIVGYEKITRFEYVTEEITLTRKVEKEREVEVPIVKTETKTDTKVNQQKQKVTFLKTAHSWNKFETFHYKEVNLDHKYELVDVTINGNKTIEVYKRKTKEWVFDTKDWEYNYTKFDQVLTDLKFEESAVMLLVEALKENNIPLDNYRGQFFDVFLIGGMGMIIPQDYLSIYKAAEEMYGVQWNYLASIHYVETKFSTVPVMVSSAGAIGHFQFMPCTWLGWAHSSCSGKGAGNIPDDVLKDPSAIKKYGGYGIDANKDGYADPWDLEDAALSAANLLSNNGFSSDPKKAIRKYNHSDKYVADVVHYAELFASSQGNIPNISDGTFMRPAVGPITSGFGTRIDPKNGTKAYHSGVDIGKRGEIVPIVASANGRVVQSGDNNTYGQSVIIEHIIDGEVWQTLYAHMVTGSIRVQVGDLVEKGQILGLMGATGRVTGPHLHFEVHRGKWNGSRSNAIDPVTSGIIKWD